jgi:pimeloyl-ACP methyl ester carboxylesterase
VLALMRAVMRWTQPRPEIVTTADQLRSIRHPVRLIWGQRDRFAPPEAGRRIAALIPDADLHVVPGGHAPWFHHADPVAALIREFLNSSEEKTS